jgi:hypothetical protein
MRARTFTRAALAAALALCGCRSAPPPAPPAAPAPGARAAAFDRANAWGHLEQLAEAGPRVSGSEGNRRARAYLRGELEKLGLEIVEQEVTVRLPDGESTLELRNLAALVPGASTDVFLLAAPYDSRRFESFEYEAVSEVSGAAVLLEVARVLAGKPLPYTTAIVFLDGEAPLTPGESGSAPRSHLGSRGLAQRLVSQEVVESVRLALVVNRVCDADLRIARDSSSHRNYREWLFDAARRAGRGEAFPREAAYEETDAGHEALKAGGIARVLAVVDTSFGGDEPPGAFAGTEDDDLDHCSAESLETVGVVLLEALGDISERLARIDRFSKSPVAGARMLELEHLSGDAAEEQPGEPAPGEAQGASAPGPEAPGVPVESPLEPSVQPGGQAGSEIP